MDDFSKWYRDRMKRSYPGGRRMDNNRETRVIIIDEPRHSDPYRQYHPNIFERTMFYIVAAILVLYLIWLLVIQPIIVWFQSAFISFIHSIQNYIFFTIFVILTIIITKFFEKRGTMRPWSILIGGLASASIMLLIIALSLM